MSAGIMFNGQMVYAPGVYSLLDVTSLAGRGPTPRGVVAVLLESARGGQPLVPHMLTGDAYLRRAFPIDNIGVMGKILFDPSRDKERIPNGASAVVMVRVNPATKAGMYLDDAQDNHTVRVNAADWGLYGNDIIVTTEVEEGDTIKTIVTKGTESQVVEGAGDMEALNFKYTEPDGMPSGWAVTAANLTINPNAADGSPGITIAYAFTGPADTPRNPSAWMAFDGTIRIAIGAQTGGASRAFVVTGILKADFGDKVAGESDTETVTVPSNGNATSSRSWSEITSIDTPTALEGDATFSGYAFLLPIKTSVGVPVYDTLAKVLDKLNSTGRGFAVEYLTGQINLAITDLDGCTAESMLSDGHDATANLYDYITKCSAGINLVTFSRVAGAYALINGGDDTHLTGGSNGVATASDWQAALDALKAVGVNTIVPMTTDPAIHAKVGTHCAFMWGKGRYERNYFVGTATGRTTAQLKSAVIALNSAFGALVPQQIRMYNDAGVSALFDPTYAALLAASMNAGRSASSSIMWSTADVLDFVDCCDTVDRWSSDADKEELIRAGVLFLEKDIQTNLIRWSTDGTTYLIDDNPILGSITATEDSGYSIHNVRTTLEWFVGRKGFAGTKKEVKNRCDRELDRQVKNGEIKAYDKRSIAVEDLGNGYDVAYKAAIAEPTRFITHTAHVVRMPTTA